MTDHYYWNFAEQEENQSYQAHLRKATTMMNFVQFGLGPLVKALFEEGEDLSKVSLFLSSLHGEIEPTLGFLKGLAQKNWARPFLFQNSLHHSTTGFMSQHFQLLGPSYSLCAIENPQQELLQLGTLMGKRSNAPILLIHCECFPSELAELSPYSKIKSCEILFLKESVFKRWPSDMNAQSFKEVIKSLAPVSAYEAHPKIEM